MRKYAKNLIQSRVTGPMANRVHPLRGDCTVYFCFKHDPPATHVAEAFRIIRKVVENRIAQEIFRRNSLQRILCNVDKGPTIRGVFDPP